MWKYLQELLQLLSLQATPIPAVPIKIQVCKNSFRSPHYPIGTNR